MWKLVVMALAFSPCVLTRKNKGKNPRWKGPSNFKGCKAGKARECPVGFVKCFNENDLPQHCYKPSECPQPEKDAEGVHNFAVQRIEERFAWFYGNHVATLGLPPHRYHAVVRFSFKSAKCAEKVYGVKITEGNFLSMRILKKQLLLDILKSNGEFEAQFRNQPLDVRQEGNEITKCQVVRKSTLDVRRFVPLATPGVEYPEEQKYFMYGYRDSVFMSHVATKCPDYAKIVKLESRPHSLKPKSLTKGALVYLSDVAGSPKIADQKIVNPIPDTEYTFYMEKFWWKNFCLRVEKSSLFDVLAINAGCQ